MYDLSRFGRIFMMDFTAGSSLVFETGMCRKRWWYLVEYGTEHLILCAGVMVCAWTDLKYGKVRNYWLWLLTVAGVLHRGSAFFSVQYYFWQQECACSVFVLWVQGMVS